MRGTYAERFVSTAALWAFGQNSRLQKAAPTHKASPNGGDYLPSGWTKGYDGPPPSDSGRYVLAQIRLAEANKGASRGSSFLFDAPNQLQEQLARAYELKTEVLDRSLLIFFPVSLIGEFSQNGFRLVGTTISD